MGASSQALGELHLSKGQPFNVEGYRRLAKQRLPRPVFDFVDGGAGDERTLRANLTQYARYSFVPRVLGQIRNPDLSTHVSSMELRLPVIFAPVGMAGMIHPHGERAAAAVASGGGASAVISHASSYSMEEAAAGNDVSRLWMNILPWRDRALYATMLDRASRAGYGGVCLTVDAVVFSNRERDTANGWSIPPRIAGNLRQFAAHPGWVARTVRYRRVTMRNFDDRKVPLLALARRAGQSVGEAMGHKNRGISWEDMAWIRDSWGGALAVKGAFSPSDAERLAALGVDALFVGNHGGRQLDDLQAPLEQMPALIDAVGDRLDLVVDGGIRRGADVVKAICLGAKAAVIGRPWVYALAVDGTRGVQRVLHLLEREIEMTLGLLGVRSVSELDSSLVVVRR